MYHFTIHSALALFGVLAVAYIFYLKRIVSQSEKQSLISHNIPLLPTKNNTVMTPEELDQIATMVANKMGGGKNNEGPKEEPAKRTEKLAECTLQDLQRHIIAMHKQLGNAPETYADLLA